eukprot:gene29704-38835_t
MSTTLNNLTGSGGPSPASLSVVCAPDLIIMDGDVSSSSAIPPRVRLVHSMPGRKEAMVIEESARKDLARILSLSFHPMANSPSVITEQDKALLWELENSPRVQELYDLLDLWTPPSPLKFENYVDSALSRFLLRRALTNQRVIGHIYYWLLQSEVYNKDVSGIDVKKCRVMESKKKPLWLTLKDADGGQDIVLIVKLLRVMDELWSREGLDMQMKLYGCISTGYERGLLQISSAIKAFTDFSFLGDWIIQQVDDELAKNFMISTAAYCVASYLLGLGDRHNDNLMMATSGHFFHIDFGHILGNFKSKMGVKRERAPFVFTHAMKAVMKEEEQYSAFTDLCCDIYNILRENSALLVSLFSLAIPCNLPELQEERDVMWIYEKLLVGATEDEAADHFRKQLEISLNTKTTRLNDAAHMLAHA